MKKIIFTILILSILGLAAQNIFNSKKGIAVKGYDVVAYFSGNVIKGDADFSVKHNDLNYRFSTEKNKELFTNNPSKYIPQYGGWCAYAMGKDGSKVDIDPETYEIRDGKLYLFYNKFGTNTLDLWINENTSELKVAADKNWENVKSK